MSKQTMRCSVIIPAYNAASTIHNTLLSILVNLQADDEIIVVDDGSQDDTVIACQNIDHRVSVLSIKNGGPANARNQGIAAAQGELIAFCDADDLWHAEKLAQQRICFAQHPGTGLCFTDYQIIDPENNILTTSAITDRDLPAKHSLASMLATNPVLTSSVVAPRSILQDIGGFPATWDDKLQMHLSGEDYETWIAIAERWPVKMITNVLVSYRRTPDGMFLQSVGNRQASQELLRRRIALIRRTAERNPDAVSSAHASKAISEICFRAAYNERINGYFVSSAKLLAQSIWYGPRRLKAYIDLARLPLLSLNARLKNRPS